MFLPKLCYIGIATVSILAASRMVGAQEGVNPNPSRVPATTPASGDARLSLMPKSLPLPAELQLGSPDVPRYPGALSLREALTLRMPAMEAPGFLEEVGRVIDVQETYWPLGTEQAGHFQWLNGDGIGQWTPFFSVMQEVDEADAHVRNGVGGGFTYRFNHDAQVDIEADYLGGSGDVNPALSDEGRVSLIFSFTF